MGRLNIDEVQAGMVLAADVIDRNGRVLLKSGLSVTDKHLTILKQWGITDADIQDVDREEITAKATEGLDPELLSKTETKYQELFIHTDRRHPFIQELFRLSVLRIVNHNMGLASSDH